MKEMVKKRKRMISKIRIVFFFALVLFSHRLLAELIIYPSTGININSVPGSISEFKLRFKPDVDQTDSLKYRLTNFRVNGRDVDKSKLEINNIYTNGSKSLDRFQSVLSGKESGRPLESTFIFKPQWHDQPGIYIGSMSSDAIAQDIPVKVVINSKTTLILSPSNFKIRASNIDIPKIQTVNLFFGTNQPKWELYLVASDLVNDNKRTLSKNNIFVRVQGAQNYSWVSLSNPIMILSGTAIAPSNIATIEILVKTDSEKIADEYSGSIRLMMKHL